MISTSTISDSSSSSSTNPYYGDTSTVSDSHYNTATITGYWDEIEKLFQELRQYNESRNWPKSQQIIKPVIKTNKSPLLLCRRISPRQWTGRNYRRTK